MPEFYPIVRSWQSFIINQSNTNHSFSLVTRVLVFPIDTSCQVISSCFCRVWLPMWKFVLWTSPLLWQAQLSIRLQSRSCSKNQKRESSCCGWKNPENIKLLHVKRLKLVFILIYRRKTLKSRCMAIFLWCSPEFCFIFVCLKIDILGCLGVCYRQNWIDTALQMYMPSPQ